MSVYDQTLSPDQKQERLEKLAEWARKVAERFRPQKIILFGSYAYGVPTSHSDADVLVLMDTDLKSTRQAAVITQEFGQPFALDLLVRRPDELQERLELGDYFLNEIVIEG